VRARATVGGVLASLGILVAGWEIGAASHPATPLVATASGSAGGVSSSSGSASTDTSSDGTTTGAGTGTGTAGSTSSDGTWTGTPASTRFGPVQVQVVISGGQITDVVALRLTDRDGRSVQISNHAAPILRSEVLAAQSASVANVSGATYTTRGYLGSLQSALDQAGF
jgi:uncharacterized protein with FMN-binding domain